VKASVSFFFFCLCLAFAGAPVVAQQAAEGPPPPRRPAPPQEGLTGGDYRVGPDDQVTVTVFQAPELNTTTRISADGFLSLPLLGPIRASGLSAYELEQAIEERLQAKYIKEPAVTVQVTDVRSRAVNVVGAVARPGIQQIGATARLLDVMAAAGGITEDAGDVIVIRRLNAATPIEVPTKPLVESRDPALNVPLMPGDFVNVRPADVVYVVGAVRKPGAFKMRGNDRLTVIQAVALGEGLAPNAAETSARLVRTDPSGQRTEIKVDLRSMMKGKSPDLSLQAHDVVFVPISGAKVVARGAIDALVRIISFRPY
jgi:polysaccharide export outer membrane protein